MRLVCSLIGDDQFDLWFEGTGQRLGDFQFLSERLGGVRDVAETTGNRFSNGWMASIPVPLPKEMLQGVDYLQWEFERGMSCYLRGNWQHRGWWYFHLYAMAIKIPIGYWLLIAVGFGSMVVSWSLAT